jgi:hypothetical protein
MKFWLGNPTDRSEDGDWRGGYYELSIKLGPSDDARLDAALTALWDAAGLSDPSPSDRRDALRSVETAGVSAELLLVGPLDAVAMIRGLGTTLCAVTLVREHPEDSTSERRCTDWLDLCMPLGALSKIDARVGAYPFDDTTSSRSWREPIERWFEDVGRAVFGSAPYIHAVTGFEVSGMEPSEIEPGRMGLFRPDQEGALAIEPVTDWR